MMTLAVLAAVFARIGIGAFGGGLATIPFIRHELVIMQGWLSEREFSEVVSLAQMTPGPVALNAATYVGYRVGGVAGAVVSTAAVAAAPLAVIAAAAWLISRASGRPGARIEKMQKALRPVVAAMILSAFWMVLRPLGGDPRLWVFTLAVFGASRLDVFKKYPQLLLLAAGGAGMIFLR
ncbi:MAG: chromate transporter [Synergistaceae bacterium]|nr:chromate transporter [Synergistaceae bacterium]